MTSRIGKMPIEIPQGVETEINGQTVSFKGAKGELSHVVPDVLTIKLEENTLTVIPKDESKSTSSLHGLTRTLLNNMIIGVTKGYEKRLEIVGTGYRAMQKGTNLELSLGFSHQVTVEPKEGIQFSLDGQNVIIVSGIDKQQVGETAANIRKLRPPEPYKGKGIRYEGEHIIRKEGKAGK